MTDPLDIFDCLCRDFVFSMDGQGRIAVPADWRGNSCRFVIIPGKDATLQMYPAEVFQERILPKFKKLSPTNANDLAKLRELGSIMLKCTCDKQGRIQLTPGLIQHAKLDKRVALVGSVDFVQILSAERWEAEQQARNQNSSDEAFLDILGD